MENIYEIQNAVVKAVAAKDAEFVEKHKDQLDFGHCGYAVVLLSFGRKRKLKEDFIKAGLISENRTWGSYGRKEYVYELPAHSVPTQYMGFFEDRAAAAVEVLRTALEGTGVDVNIHRWVD